MKVKLVIDGYVNLEKKVKIEIPQGLPISSILFLIYISRIFNIVITISPNTISLLFMNNLGFLVNRKSIYKVVPDIKKIGIGVLR